LENRNLEEMKRVYELDVYKLTETLSDMVWHDFDKCNKKVQNTVGLSDNTNINSTKA
jgi:hypothetical protein